MDVDLTPRLAKKSYSGDGGAYYTWSSSELGMLEKAKIGAAKLALEKGGLALPSYSDSAKVAYVLQGSGRAGIALPEATKEKVVAIKKGDAIALPFGVVTWWFNSNDTELVILFLGDTSKAHQVGEFTNFQLTGLTGIFTGFTTEFVRRAWDLNEENVQELVGSQYSNGIIKLEEGADMPEPSEEDREGMVLNCEEAPLDVDIKNGGRVVVLTSQNLPLVGEVGLGADLVRIDGHAMCSPGFSSDSAYQVTYIVRGSGRVQVVGINGQRVLETQLKAGCLFIVPRFFVVAKIADEDGMEWFSIITTPNPVFSHLAGKTSVWKALSPQVLQASFNVSPELEKLFRSKRISDAIFFPQKKPQSFFFHFPLSLSLRAFVLPISRFRASATEKKRRSLSMENLESNGQPTAAAISTARTETADADNGVNAEIPASEPLTVVLSGGKKVSGGKEFQEEKDKVNNAPNEKPDVASRGEIKVLNVTEEEKLEDVSNKNVNENRPTMNIATSGDPDDGVLVSKGEKANEEEKIESTVKGREGKALAAGGKINNTPKKANRRKRKKKNTTLRIKKNAALKDSGDAVASISRGEETVSGTEKTGEDDEMKAKVGNTLNKSNKRKKLKKLTQGGTGSTGSVVSGGEEKVVLEKEVVNTPKEPNKLKRKKSISAESTDVNAILSGGDGKMEAEDGGKVESNPKKAKRRGRRGTKGKKENTTLRDAANAVAKDADKPETSAAAGKASEGAESMGMIFMCNSKTKGDCYHYKVLGLPASKKEKVLKIYKGMRLFLFDIDMKLLYGIYKAAGPGGYNIEHKAFNSAFPSQVRFSILDDCAPLPVEKFKAAIKDNFYGKNKFNCELTAEQVKNLCKLFRVTSKSSKPKQDGSVNRRDVPNSVDRGRKRRRDDDRVKRFELDGDRKRRRDDDRVKRFELDGGRKRGRGDDRVKRFELNGDRKRRRDHDRVKRSELDGDRLPARRDDVYKRTAYAPQPLPPTLPRASYEREAYASTLPSHLTPLLNVYGQPIQTGIYRSDPQHEHHHNLLTYSSSRPQREIKYEDSNILYREPLAYRDPLYPAGVPPGYYRPPY